MGARPGAASRGTVVLPLTVAVPLVTAHMDAIARGLGLRCLAIKGPVADAQTVRPAKSSTDGDLLCHPDDHRAMVQALEAEGWVSAEVDDRLGVFPQHSTTLAHPDWPCSVDVHHRYPGLGAQDMRTAFEVLWAERVEAEVAHTPVLAPSVPAHLVVTALTALRAPWASQSKAMLAWLDHRWASDVEEFAGVLATARRLQALPALRPLLESRGTPLNDAVDWASVGAPDRDWLLVTHAQQPGTLRLAQLVRAPWRHKIGMAVAAVAPSSVAMRRSVPALGAAADPAEVRAARRTRLVARLGDPLATLREYRTLRAELRRAGYRR